MQLWSKQHCNSHVVHKLGRFVLHNKKNQATADAEASIAISWLSSHPRLTDYDCDVVFGQPVSDPERLAYVGDLILNIQVGLSAALSCCWIYDHYYGTRRS